MNRAKKEQELVRFKNELDKSQALVLVDYRGIKALEMVKLKSLLRKQSVRFNVVKNNIFLLAAKESIWKEVLNENLEGPIAVGFCASKDPISMAKVLVQYFDRTERPLKFKYAYVADRKINADEFKVISKLPAKEVIIAKMLSSCNAPVSNLVGVMSGIIRKFVYTISAISNKKSQS